MLLIVINTIQHNVHRDQKTELDAFYSLKKSTCLHQKNHYHIIWLLDFAGAYAKSFSLLHHPPPRCSGHTLAKPPKNIKYEKNSVHNHYNPTRKNKGEIVLMVDDRLCDSCELIDWFFLFASFAPLQWHCYNNNIPTTILLLLLLLLLLQSIA